MRNDNEAIPIDVLSAQLICQLEERGFTHSTVSYIELEIGHLNDYLESHRASGYNPDAGAGFLEEFFADGTRSEGSRANYASLVRRLDDLYCGRDFSYRHRREKPEAPGWCKSALCWHLGVCRKNGNCEKSIERKEVACRKFFELLDGLGCRRMGDVDAARVQAASLGVAPSSRPFVRELLLDLAVGGFLAADHSTLVPKLRHAAPLPDVYSKEEIEGVERAVDASTPIGKRDRAVVLLATRLGVRAGDIAGMALGDVDFDGGEIRFVQEKTGYPVVLPLLPEVGDAIADYLGNGRPDSTSDAVFLNARPPHGAIDRTLVHAITTRYLKAAGVDVAGRRHGPHSFRSSLATAMVNSGMPYDAARKVLGHASPEAIKHYAALDVENLRRCAIDVPAPGGAFAALLAGRRCQ